MVNDKDTITIVVNMQKVEVSVHSLSPDKEIAFDAVVLLAQQLGLPSGPYIEYEVYYDNAAGRPIDGRLLPHHKVKIHNDTVFNVTYTDKS